MKKNILNLLITSSVTLFSAHAFAFFNLNFGFNLSLDSGYSYSDGCGRYASCGGYRRVKHYDYDHSYRPSRSCSRPDFKGLRAQGSCKEEVWDRMQQKGNAVCSARGGLKKITNVKFGRQRYRDCDECGYSRSYSILTARFSVQCNEQVYNSCCGSCNSYSGYDGGYSDSYDQGSDDGYDNYRPQRRQRSENYDDGYKPRKPKKTPKVVTVEDKPVEPKKDQSAPAEPAPEEPKKDDKSEEPKEEPKKDEEPKPEEPKEEPKDDEGSYESELK